MNLNAINFLQTNKQKNPLIVWSDVVDTFEMPTFRAIIDSWISFKEQNLNVGS